MNVLSPFRHLLRRPALLAGAAAGAVAGIAAKSFVPQMPVPLLAWCAGVAVYLIIALWSAGGSDAKHIRERAELLDEGAAVILILTVIAAAASIGAIVLELARAKDGAGAGLAAVTVALSWAFVHTVFAFHYAHAYYGGGGSHACLDFPGETKPLYWDFLYFSFVIGMTAQVADVATQTTGMRKLVMAHGVVAFFFNTAILALGVNLAASLADK